MSVRLIYEPTVIKAWTMVHEASIDYHSVSDDDTYEVGSGSPLDDYLQGWHPSVETASNDDIPEIAGRICYQSFKNPRPGGNKAYLGHILECGHGNVLEHSHVGFIIHGVSRSLTHELIRHRAGVAVSELSQRFVDVSDIGFVIPPRYLDDKDTLEWLSTTFEHALNVYRNLIDEPDKTTMEKKRIRESARAVLPNATETHIAVTANLRAWRNIIEQRGCYPADLEIRRLAVAIFGELVKIAPSTFQDGLVCVDEDGRESVKFEHRKV